MSVADLDAVLREWEERAEAAAPGPWEVWGGPEYVGGGADLCIGSGETWLANMDHRNCVNREAHLCGGDFSPCRREPNSDVCSLAGCRCAEECPEAVHITAEQRATADFIAASRQAIPSLCAALRLALDVIREYHPDARIPESAILARLTGEGEP